MPTAVVAKAQRTMLGFAWSPEKDGGPGDVRAPLAPVSAAPASPAPATPAPATPLMGTGSGPIVAALPPDGGPHVGSAAKATIVGLPVSDVLGASALAAIAAAQAPPPSQGRSGVAPTLPGDEPAPGPSSAVGSRDARAGTMLGVAIPGIAPLSASEPQVKSVQGTMMGVAVPGIAPTVGPGPGAASAAFPRTQPRKAVEIAPMPAPLVDDEPDLGPAPQVVKRGFPLGIVAAIVAVLVLALGTVAFFVLRSPPLTAQPRLDAQGHEQLHLVCESCQDGTVVELYDARATFQNKQADINVTHPLKVGNNPLTIVIDRPKLGRDESVQVVVPVAFRIRADLADLAATKPAISVKVEAVPGTDVKVDGKPVALDASGDATYAVDLSAEAEGPSDELRMIDRNIPYVVTPKDGKPEAGKLTVRVGIAPLHMDAPGMSAVVDGQTFRISGRTLKGATVTANGTPLHVEADGTFAQPFDVPGVGDLPVEVRASPPQLAPRTVHLTVKRVDRLENEAKAREAAPFTPYDGLASDLKAAVGKTTIVEGEVVEARTTPALTVAIVDDTRGCAKGPCLVRVTYGGETRIKHGDLVRAYGKVTRQVAYQSSTLPEVEADFVLLSRGVRR